MPSVQRRSFLTLLIALSSVAAVAQMAGLVLERATAPEVSQLRRYERGMPLPDVDLLDTHDVITPLSNILAGDCRLLVFFMESCEFCRRMAVSWGSRQQVAGGIPVTWISVPGEGDKIREFAELYSLPVPVYRIAARDDVAALGIYGTPLPVLVGARREHLGVQTAIVDSIHPPPECRPAQK